MPGKSENLALNHLPKNDTDLNWLAQVLNSQFHTPIHLLSLCLLVMGTSICYF